MNYAEVKPDNNLMKILIELSGDWANEVISYGYVKNSPADILDKRVFVAEEDGCVVGYLLAHAAEMKNHRSIAPDGTQYFEIDELYVRKDRRSQGIGKALFETVERTASSEKIELLMLSTSTKNHRAVLHFYIDEVGMNFWSASLYKRIEN